MDVASAGLPGKSLSNRGAPAGASARDEQPLVLVVDDDATNRKVIGAMLNRLGLRYHVATDGFEAIDAVSRERYGAVLMDCLMPGMDGYQATSEIRRREREATLAGGRRHLPIVAVTAVAVRGARQQCLDAGMDDYLSKPIVRESLACVLDRWLTAQTADDARAPAAGQEQASEDDGPLDRGTLDALRELELDDGPSLLGQLIDDFSSDIPPRLTLMRQAADSGDLVTLNYEAHYIAGCAAVIGARRVERLARGIGALDEATRLQQAGSYVERLEAAFDEARRCLERLAA